MRRIQAEVNRLGRPYLLTDLRSRDPSAYSLLGMELANPSRRWFYVFRPSSQPVKIIHRVEPDSLDELKGRQLLYSTRAELTDALSAAVSGHSSVMMHYSADIPVLSIVDAGTVDLVRRVATVEPAAMLLNRILGTHPSSAFDLQRRASIIVDRTRRRAFELLADGARNLEVHQFILREFRAAGLVTEGEPVVAFGADAANPHFDTPHARSRRVRRGDCILIDLWARFTQPSAIFFDSTWCGFCGPVPKDYRAIFLAVRGARDAAIELLLRSYEKGRVLKGREVDACSRAVLAKSGFERFIVHRTGHSIGRTIHGQGANLDSWETNDVRELLPLSSFSVEPGIYIPGKCGVRLETTIAVDRRGKPSVVGELQQEPIVVE